MSKTELDQVFALKNAATGMPIELAMQRLWLVGRITGVGARLLVKHVFKSKEKKPLEVIYSFMLPRDSALRRFRISGKDFSVSSELKPVEKAIAEYEQALAEGHTAVMARQYRDGIVNLTVGNIRPGEEVTAILEIMAGVETRDDGIRFRFPFTLAPSYHARARAAEVAPGAGEIELPADEFGDLFLPQFMSDASSLHEVGFDLMVSMGSPIVSTGSPSHAIRVVRPEAGRARVSLATAKALPNKDLVLDVRTTEKMDGVLAGTGSDGRGHFVAVVPSSAFKAGGQKEKEEEPRRVVFVLDRSGSMGGEPMKQARNAVNVCLAALGADDEFGIVAFDHIVETLGSGLVKASMENRDMARTFLEGINARGGTELAAGVNAAASLLKKAGGGGDLMVVTDGQVSGTEDILAVARANGIRLHCMGIGSASQDRFLTLLARETGGVSRFVTPRERVDLGAVELFAAVGRPLGGGLMVRGEGLEDLRIAPDLPNFVFDGTPIVFFGDTAGAGEGRLLLEWDAGGEKRTLAVPLRIGSGGDGETLRLLQGARLITDLESRYRGKESEGRTGRDDERIRKRLVALSEKYGLVSREMGLVAKVVRAGDQPGDLPVTKVVPVGLAQDVDMGAYFAIHWIQSNMMLCSPDIEQAPAVKYKIHDTFENLMEDSSPTPKRKAEKGAVSADALIKLASALEADGGMPGGSEEERVQATILALLQFLADGHSVKRGAFRAHVKRMVDFLENSELQNDVIEEIIRRARSGRALAGDWPNVKTGRDLWRELEKAIALEKALG